MAVDPKKLGAVFRQCRRRLGMTQAELAAQLGTSQAAVSMFEAHVERVFSRETVERAAGILGIDVETGRPREDTASSAVVRCAKYCRYALCPSNIPYAVGEELVFWPVDQTGHRGWDEGCRWCARELLETCPNPECGAPYVFGQPHCATCRTPYVVHLDPLRGDLEAWADARRQRIRELRELAGL